MNTSATAQSRRSGLRRIFALGGVLVPVLFATVVAVAGALRPEYSHTSRSTISELGATSTDRAALLNAVDFVPTGLCTKVILSGAKKAIPDCQSQKIWYVEFSS